ncbi:MAG: TolC family protein [Bacteroidetes bacterium]|jgi:outer membrane protein TolC|nr:TolC family protein [Bacteroidota bacterium]MBT6687715.1 TolC family protein [Bacteroidota bacterium]MBT7143691.1 TolC family protein [Bacteroidota bacterium]MBT7493297.1 TolC family protein [Bacteroidota bacterium]
MNYTTKILIIVLLFFSFKLFSQQKTILLTLEEVIDLAVSQSPDSYIAKHRFLGKYWQYRTFKANYLPSLSLNSTLLNYNKSIRKTTLDGQDVFLDQNSNNSSMQLSLNQNIGPTGGSIYLNSDVLRLDQFNDSTTSYSSSPISIGIVQPILSFNSLKWERKIEPIKYEEAKKEYVESIEQISMDAVSHFFELLSAQLDVQISKINFLNTDTLFKISEGRFNIGKIAQNELLQMELSFLNSNSDVNNSELNLKIMEFRLRSFLGFNETVKLELIVPYEIPKLEINVSQAMDLALKNNPDILSYHRQLVEAKRDVAQAKAENRFNANLSLNYGLSQTATEAKDVYIDPQQTSNLYFGIDIPIIDWGLGKGEVKMAKSNEELTKIVIEQAEIDFQQNVFLKVMQFNMQNEQVRIAAKADTIAQSRYDVTKQRFLIGKVDVLNLNDALTEKDVKKRSYISSLRSYWNYYFTIRMLTLYDFEKEEPLMQDFEKLVE